jgi:restriction system protein
MPIPDYQTLMPSVLKVAAEGQVRTSDVIELLADDYQLTEADLEVRWWLWTPRPFANAWIYLSRTWAFLPTERATLCVG